MTRGTAGTPAERTTANRYVTLAGQCVALLTVLEDNFREMAEHLGEFVANDHLPEGLEDCLQSEAYALDRAAHNLVKAGVLSDKFHLKGGNLNLLQGLGLIPEEEHAGVQNGQ